MPQDLVMASVPVGKPVLVGRTDDAFKLTVRQADTVFFIPFKHFFSDFHFVEAEKPKLRCQANRAIIPVARFNRAFPHFLHPGTGEGEAGDVFGAVEVIPERSLGDAFDLPLNALVKLGTFGVFFDHHA